MAPEDSYSRVVEYRIDEEQMTVQQVWEYSPSGIDRLYTPAKSDVDWLPTTGNVLITYSVVAYVGGEKSCALGLGSQHTRIQEVDHGTPAQKVFEVAIYDASDQVSACPDLEIYRSERIPSLYPSTVSVLHAPALTLAAKSNQVRRGGAARYVVTVTNPASTRECYDYWANLTLPDGSIAPAAGEFVGPVSFCLDPFSTASRTFYQPVPTGAQVGPYTYHAHVGTYPLVLTQTDGPFYVTP
jgi:hypothetical protein